MAVFSAFAEKTVLADAGEAELALRLGLAESAMRSADSAMIASSSEGRRDDGAFAVAAAAREKILPPAELLAWIDSFTNRPPVVEWIRARALTASGRPEEAAADLEKLSRSIPETDPVFHSVVADRAHALSMCDRDADAALALAGLPSSSSGPAAAFAAAAEILAGKEPSGDVSPRLAALAYATAAALQTAVHHTGSSGFSATVPPVALENAAKSVSLAASDAETLEECLSVQLELVALKGNADEALAIARSIVLPPTPDFAAEAIRFAANAFLAHGDASTALLLSDLHLTSVVSGLTAECAVRKIRAIALEKLGRTAEAVSAWDSTAEAASVSGDAKTAAEARVEAIRVALPALGFVEAKRRAETLRSDGSLPSEVLARLAMLEAEIAEAEGSEESPEAFEKAAALAPSPTAGSNAMVRARLSSALRLSRSGDAEGAVRELEAAANGPSPLASERARALLPAAYQSLGRMDEAFAAFSDFTNRYPRSVFLPDVGFWYASTAFNSGKWDEAAEQLSAFAAQSADSPKAPYAEYLAAVALVKAGREGQAVQVLDNLISSHPDSDLVPEALIMQAEALASLMRFDEAAAAFARAATVERDPAKALKASTRRADCLWAIGGDLPEKRSESLSLYRSIVAAPECAGAGLEPECRWKIGRALEKSGDTESALDEWFDGCIAPFEKNPSPEVAPWYSRAVFSSAAILSATGRRDAARSILLRLSETEGAPGREEAARRAEAL